jgi:hypothetical protein
MEEARQIKFIKFFAWENKWIQRVLDARQTELRWLIRCTKDQLHFSEAESVLTFL